MLILTQCDKTHQGMTKTIRASTQGSTQGSKNGDVATQRTRSGANLHHGSRGASGSAGLTPEAMRRHEQLAFLQQEVSSADITAATAMPAPEQPAFNLDLLRRSIAGSDDWMQSAVGSIATTGTMLAAVQTILTDLNAQQPQSTALVAIGDSGVGVEEDRVLELQRTIVQERLQRERAEADLHRAREAQRELEERRIQESMAAEAADWAEEAALHNQLNAKLNETLQFIEQHGHHNELVKECRSLDSIEDIICRIAACESSCKDLKGKPVSCHLRDRLGQAGSTPVPVQQPAPQPAPATTSVQVQAQQEQVQDMAIDTPNRFNRFPAPEIVVAMVCDEEPLHHPPHQPPIPGPLPHLSVPSTSAAHGDARLRAHSRMHPSAAEVAGP